jgi:hypothetical protein
VQSVLGYEIKTPWGPIATFVDVTKEPVVIGAAFSEIPKFLKKSGHKLNIVEFKSDAKLAGVTSVVKSWVDGDVDALEKMVPDEVTGTEKNQTLLQKKFKDKYAKEKRHTRVGVAFESTEPCCDECDEQFDHIVEETEYEGRKVKLNDPFRTPGGPKKFSVYVKNEKGNVVKVNFGDPNMEIKRDDPARRASFRARHGCDNPGPKWKAKYWSCYQWRAGAKVEN